MRSTAITFWIVAMFAIAQLAPTSAQAATPADAVAPNLSAWVGRYCTPTGCAGSTSSPFAQAASFGAAVLATGFLARRRRA